MFLRNFGLGDPETESICCVDMVKVFNEDFPVLEAQQRNMDLNLSRIDIAVDATPLAARRMLQAMIQQETGL